jgi:hypothetical protein
MNKKENNTPILEDMKVNVKIKLSLLWIALMFFYLYNDVFTLFQPGVVEDLMAGHIEGIQFNQTVLFAAAVLMSIPIFMIFLSVILSAKVNRRTNIGLGIFHAVVLVSTLFVGSGPWAYYALYMVFEAVFIGLIIWHAWNWPTLEGKTTRTT